MHSAGEFEATVLDHGFCRTTTGKDQFFIKFKTGDGEIVGYFAMTNKAIEHTIKKIRAIGFHGDDIGDLADGNAMRGLRCKITVAHETYEGKTSAKVGFVNNINSVGGNVKRDNEAAMRAKQFNALLKKTPKQEATKADIDAANPNTNWDEVGPPPIDDKNVLPF